jgi:hypothetical protein
MTMKVQGEKGRELKPNPTILESEERDMIKSGETHFKVHVTTGKSESRPRAVKNVLLRDLTQGA